MTGQPPEADRTPPVPKPPGRRWLVPQGYPTLVLLVMFGIVATALAWLSVGLLNIAMENLSFLQRHGARAVAEGGLVQSAGIAAQSVAVLALYLAFRGIEGELIARWVRRTDD